jgi:hypothetical protein
LATSLPTKSKLFSEALPATQGSHRRGALRCYPAGNLAERIAGPSFLPGFPGAPNRLELEDLLNENQILPENDPFVHLKRFEYDDEDLECIAAVIQEELSCIATVAQGIVGKTSRSEVNHIADVCYYLTRLQLVSVPFAEDNEEFYGAASRGRA